MSHPLLVMPLPFRTVRSLRRPSKDNTGLNLQGPDVNRESREQISGQHRGVRRSPWMPPSPLPSLNEAEKGQWSPRAFLGHKRPFYIKESWRNLAGVSALTSEPPPLPPRLKRPKSGIIGSGRSARLHAHSQNRVESGEIGLRGLRVGL